MMQCPEKKRQSKLVITIYRVSLVIYREFGNFISKVEKNTKELRLIHDAVVQKQRIEDT